MKNSWESSVLVWSEDESFALLESREFLMYQMCVCVFVCLCEARKFNFDGFLVYSRDSACFSLQLSVLFVHQRKLKQRKFIGQLGNFQFALTPSILPFQSEIAIQFN